MKVWRALGGFPAEYRGGAVSIGNFDGVHLGHAQLIARLIASARALGGPSLAFTFDPPPSQLLRPDRAPPPISTVEQRLARFEQLGLDGAIVYPTDRALLSLTADEFFRTIVQESLGARGLVEGDNFLFGRDRGGDVPKLRSLCAAANVALEIVSPSLIDGRPVSSSRVRERISAGDVTAARRLLGRPYVVEGVVEHGAKRGREIGFPTANLGEVATLLPSPGIYAGLGTVGEKTWPAAIHLGPIPTFGVVASKLEVF
ncbi:MAG TPA: riboflavin kinase, partial [Pirellulales bacterium]